MNLSDELIKQLEQGMYGYNPVVYDLMGKVSQSLTVVGVGLAVFFFWFDFEVQARAFEEAGTTPDAMSYSKLAMKYVMTIIVIMNSGMILNFILWIAIQIIKWESSIIGSAKIDSNFESASGIWGKIISMFAGISSIIAQMIIKVLILLRFIQMYLFRGIAPVILAFFAQKDLRGNAIQFLKRFGGYAFQGAVIILTIAILAALQKSLIIKVDSTGTWLDSFKGVTQGIVQSVVTIVAILGTQKISKDFLER